MGAALRRETPVPVLQLLQAEAGLPGPASGSEDPDRHSGVSTLGQHVRRGRLRTGTARERQGRPPPPHAGAGDTRSPVGIPTLLLAREACGRRAVLGCKDPGVSIRQALKHYISFYEKAAEYRDALVVGFFEEVTRGLRTVLERVNAKFGTEFDLRSLRRERQERLRPYR